MGFYFYKVKRPIANVMPLSRLYFRCPLKKVNLFILSILISSFFYAGCAGTAKARKEKAVAIEDMGISLVLQGKSREGLAYLLEAAELDPKNPDIEHELALVYEDIGEYDLALQHFNKAIGLKPGFSAAVNNLGILYTKMDEWDKALECFQQAASDYLYTTPHFAYHNMGLVYYYKGDYPKAIELYQKSLKLAPSYVNVYYDLASVYIALNRFDDAVEIYKKAASLSTQSWQANLGLARLYIRMDRREEAIEELKNIIESDPRSQAAKDANQLLEELNKK